MKAIPHLHNFIDELPELIQQELKALCVTRHVAAEEPVYRQGDKPSEMYQLLEGSVRLCNYTYEGKEVGLGRFRPGDCFGEMGIIDGLPRVSHVVANEKTTLQVLSKKHFDLLYRKYPQISYELNLMLCRRVRLLYGMAEDSASLTLRQRLARTLLRLLCSHGVRDPVKDALYVSMSHEELGNLVGASRQSITKEVKVLQAEGGIATRYGRIYFNDIDALQKQYEGLMGAEQISPVYDDANPE